MSGQTLTGLFVAEGSSDAPLADHVERLFLERGTSLRLIRPDFARLPKVPRDVGTRARTGLALAEGAVDLLVVHRDADNVGYSARLSEISAAVESLGVQIVPTIPVRMTEAWLLLDEDAIRRVVGNPRGRVDLCLPKVGRLESLPDPKEVLRECLLRAADNSGRRRTQVAKRFNQHRRQLLEQLDPHGPGNHLDGWRKLVASVRRVHAQLTS